jgi:hypothetical protein
VAARALRSPDLARLVRHGAEDQRRFPLQIATVLSQQFASHGLQFFKVKKTVTHVSVARPHFLDLETTPVSEGVKRIVEFINANPNGTRRKLVEALAPSPAPATIQVPPPEAAASPSPAVAEAAGPTPEQTVVISDLHWLIHQGHVIEFANGILETAKKPLPRPPKPEVKSEIKPADATPDAASPGAAPETSVSNGEPDAMVESAAGPTEAPMPVSSAEAGPEPVTPSPAETALETSPAPAESQPAP